VNWIELVQNKAHVITTENLPLNYEPTQ